MGKFPAIQVQRSKYADKVVAGETAITGEQIKNALNEMVVLVVENITAMTDDDINGLKSGDVVLKKTGDAYHSYRVSYKQDNQGICLTYSDASIVETVSYDLVDGHWVYNSTDKSTIENRQEKLSSSSVNDGTPDKVIAFDAQGNLIKGSVGGGTKLYKHHIVLSNYFDKLYSYNVNEDGTITVTNRTAAYAEKSIEVISTREETFINIELLRNSSYFIYIQSGAFGTNNYYDVVIYTNSNDNKTYVNCRDQKGGIVYGYYNGIMNITSDTVIEL